MADIRRAAEELCRAFDANDDAGGRVMGASDRESKGRALVRLTFAVESRCERCIARAVRKAAQAGVERREVAAAVESAVRAGDGAMLVFAAEALATFDALSPAPRNKPIAPIERAHTPHRAAAAHAAA